MTKFTFRAATLAVLALGAASTAAFAADSDMMKMSAVDCMMDMHKPKAPTAG